MQKATRSGGIHDKPRCELYLFVAANATESHCVAAIDQGIQPDLVHVMRAQLLCLLHEQVVKVCAIPVRIGDRIVRAGCNQELIALFRIRRRGSSQDMMMKGEPALQTAGDMRISALPASPLCEGASIGRS